MARSITAGDSVNLTMMKIGSHTGTHCDAASHMITDGSTVDRLPLETLVGPGKVIDVDSEIIDKGALRRHNMADAERVLFKTRNSLHIGSRDFVEDYVYLDMSGAEYLIELGIKLVGIDYLSIDKFGDRSHGVHKLLLRNSVVIFEALDLSEVPPGDYEIIALPLRIKGGDGAPARVVLREL